MQITFEIHTLKHGRWEIDKRLNTKEAAMDHAEDLRRDDRLEGVKVIKDVLDASSGTSKEYVVFDTTRAPRVPGPAAKKQDEAAAAAAKPVAPMQRVLVEVHMPPPINVITLTPWFLIRSAITLMIILIGAGFAFDGIDYLRYN